MRGVAIVGTIEAWTAVSRVGSRAVEVCIAAAVTLAVESLGTLEAAGACVVIATAAGEGRAVS